MESDVDLKVKPNRPVIRTPYDDDYVDDGIDCSVEPSKTIQSERDNCDINILMERFQRTGVLPMMQGQAQYGDFSTPVEFLDAMQIVTNAQAAFNSLPADLRARFGNDPRQFLAFVDDPVNADELIKLGLRTPPPAEPDNEAVGLAAAEGA